MPNFRTKRVIIRILITELLFIGLIAYLAFRLFEISLIWIVSNNLYFNTALLYNGSDSLNYLKISFILPIRHRFQMLLPFPFPGLCKMFNKCFTE